jgi:hypothetical protein
MPVLCYMCASMSPMPWRSPSPRRPGLAVPAYANYAPGKGSFSGYLMFLLTCYGTLRSHGPDGAPRQRSLTFARKPTIALRILANAHDLEAQHGGSLKRAGRRGTSGIVGRARAREATVAHLSPRPLVTPLPPPGPSLRPIADDHDDLPSPFLFLDNPPPATTLAPGLAASNGSGSTRRTGGSVYSQASASLVASQRFERGEMREVSRQAL